MKFQLNKINLEHIMSVSQNKVAHLGLQGENYEGGANAGVSSYMSIDMIEQSKDICKRAHNPIKLTWNNLNFKVKIEKQDDDGKKEVIEQSIIKDVSGYAMPG